MPLVYMSYVGVVLKGDTNKLPISAQTVHIRQNVLTQNPNWHPKLYVQLQFASRPHEHHSSNT